jgi:hypothetical protein
MPFRLLVIPDGANPVTNRVVPVRFARAVAGFSEDAAPDLDDHGFTLPSNFCTARGPVVGIKKAGTVRVKVIRDRIEPTAQLFPVIDDVAIAALAHPAAGTALNPADVPAAGTEPERIGDCIYLNGTSTARGSAETKLKLRHGSAGGPIVAELAVRVYPVLTIRVSAHGVSINGAGGGITLATVRRLFNMVNEIYAQAGVRFSVDPAVLPEAVAGFARAGTVTLTNVADSRNTELQTVLNQHPTADRLNAYFFDHYFDTVINQQDQTLGIAFSRDSANANPPNAATGFPGCQAGITVRVSGDMSLVAHTTAHEIGHALQLEHYGRGNGAQTRHDIWAHRCLMHNLVDLAVGAPPQTEPRTHVGYGRYSDGLVRAGQLLTTKQRSRISQSDQINTLRRALLNGSYKPVARGP